MVEAQQRACCYVLPRVIRLSDDVVTALLKDSPPPYCNYSPPREQHSVKCLIPNELVDGDHVVMSVGDVKDTSQLTPVVFSNGLHVSPKAPDGG